MSRMAQLQIVQKHEAERETPAQEAARLRTHISFLMGSYNRTLIKGIEYLTLEELREAGMLAYAHKYEVRCMIREARERYYRTQLGMVALNGMELLAKAMTDSEEA